MRYIAKRDWLEDEPLLPNLDVDNRDPVDTRLLDRLGRKIYRLPNPIGFGRRL